MIKLNKTKNLIVTVSILLMPLFWFMYTITLFGMGMDYIDIIFPTLRPNIIINFCSYGSCLASSFTCVYLYLRLAEVYKYLRSTEPNIKSLE